MAVLKQIMHKKNSDGSYDTIYLRTRVDNVLMTDNITLLSTKLSAMDTSISGKMNTSGGTFTGNVSGKYFTGTWLQTTSSSNLGSAASKICVLDSSGWIYFRTAADILSDIGAAAASHSHSGYASSSHNHDGTYAAASHTHSYAASSHTHAASQITSGTFNSTATYAKTGTDYTTARIRNIKASTTDLTAGTSTLSSGDIYLVYE